MTTAMDEPDVYGTGGAAPPSFSGKMSDCSQWRVDAKIWHNGARMKDEQKGSRLYSGQSNKHVKNVMLKVGLDNIFKSEGFDKILSAMDKKFQQKKETKATEAFDRFDDIYRQKGEDVEDYVLRSDTAFDDVQRADPHFTMSERALTMFMLKRLRVSKLNRALILGKLEDDMTSSSLSQVVQELFPGGLPWEDDVKKAPSRSLTDDDLRDDTAMMNEEHDEDGCHEDTALLGKGKGKGKDKSNNTCTRCLNPGHDATWCRLAWEKCQVNHAKAKQSKFTDLASVAFACTHCGHPDCEGVDHEEDDSEGWIVASSSDDDDIYFEPME